MFQTTLQKIRQNLRFTDWLMLILAVFTGSFFIYRDLGIRMLVGFCFLCLVLLIHLMRRLALDRTPGVMFLRLPYLALSLVILLNFLRPDSLHDADSISYILSMVITCGFVTLAAPDAREAGRTLKVLGWAGFLMAAFVVFFVVFEELFWDSVFHLLTPVAQEYLLFFVPSGYAITLGGCTFTCYILFFGMAACCGLLCCDSRWTKKSTVLALLCVFLMLALMLVGRRGELLGALVCCAVLILAMCTPKQRRLLVLFGIVLTAVLFGLMVLYLPQLKQISFLERYIVTIENLLNGQDITSGRLTLYLIALAAFREHPLFGIGWDQYQTLIPAGYLTDPVVGIEDTHCIYLQFLCETGIIGALLIVAALVCSYWQVCVQFRRLKRRRGESGELSLAFGLSVSSFMIQSFLLFVGIYDPNFQRIIFWCFYALSVLLMIAAQELEGCRPADPVSRAMDRAFRKLRPGLNTLWQTLRTPWKEGK